MNGKRINRKMLYVGVALILVGAVMLTVALVEQRKASLAASATTVPSVSMTTAEEVVTTETTTTQVVTTTTTTAPTTRATTTAPTTTRVVTTTQEVKKPYLIKVNRLQNIVIIYALDANNEYTVPYKAMCCSCGLNGATPTGQWKTTHVYGSAWRKMVGGVYAKYATRIVGSYLFHSVPYFTADSGDLEYEEYNKLGTAASAGCVRLCCADAKWITDNCPVGTTVIIYDSSDPEPLARPVPIVIDVTDSRRGWDPTDPNGANPWLQ